jgi:hypothetical protein
MAPSKETLFGGGGNVIRAFKPFVSEVVVMNASFVPKTSLLEQASFLNTTFQHGISMSSEKNTKVT